MLSLSLCHYRKSRQSHICDWSFSAGGEKCSKIEFSPIHPLYGIFIKICFKNLKENANIWQKFLCFFIKNFLHQQKMLICAGFFGGILFISFSKNRQNM